MRNARILIAPVVIALATVAGLSASAAAAMAFSADQKAAVTHLGSVTGTGLACGYGKVALPLKETVVTIADTRGMDDETRTAIRDMFAKARDTAFAEVGAKTTPCPVKETYDVTAQLAKLRLQNAFAEK